MTPPAGLAHVVCADCGHTVFYLKGKPKPHCSICGAELKPLPGVKPGDFNEWREKE